MYLKACITLMIYNKQCFNSFPWHFHTTLPLDYDCWIRVLQKKANKKHSDSDWFANESFTSICESTQKNDSVTDQTSRHSIMTSFHSETRFHEIKNTVPKSGARKALSVLYCNLWRDAHTHTSSLSSHNTWHHFRPPPNQSDASQELTATLARLQNKSPLSLIIKRRTTFFI